MVEEINFYSRKSEYGFLSNFWRSRQRIQEPNSIGFYEVETNEHFYQAEKAKDMGTKWWIRRAPTPYAAMMAGRSLRPKEMIDGWDDKRVGVMLKGLRAKFKNPELRQLLLDTGDAILHEDSPTDMFWGKLGEDMLGKLLMQVRDEIKNEKREPMKTYEDILKQKETELDRIREISNYKENDIDKIIFACKEADCGLHCRLYVNVSSQNQEDAKKNIMKYRGPPITCPFRIVLPIWRYEGINLVKKKVDEVVIHG